jgi:hypothetical protein
VTWAVGGGEEDLAERDRVGDWVGWRAVLRTVGSEDPGKPDGCRGGATGFCLGAGLPQMRRSRSPNELI